MRISDTQNTNSSSRFRGLRQILIAGALLAAGLAAPASAAEADAAGGPLETAQASDLTFKSIFASWTRFETPQPSGVSVPALMPVKNARNTSTFGTRSDPFKGTVAMHSGIDLAGPLGTPIYATADGMVNRATVVGGYGNLIELNHGQGIQTRYGHLSSMMVRAGQRVKRGQLIALMGSTGRSTGSHLHYEVRIDGAAVNPTAFMQAGDHVQIVQQARAQALSAQLAMGGPADAGQR